MWLSKVRKGDRVIRPYFLVISMKTLRMRLRNRIYISSVVYASPLGIWRRPPLREPGSTIEPVPPYSIRLIARRYFRDDKITRQGYCFLENEPELIALVLSLRFNFCKYFVYVIIVFWCKKLTLFFTFQQRQTLVESPIILTRFVSLTHPILISHTLLPFSFHFAIAIPHTPRSISQIVSSFVTLHFVTIVRALSSSSSDVFIIFSFPFFNFIMESTSMFL